MRRRSCCMTESHGKHAQWWQNRYTLDEYHERIKAVPHLEIARIEDAGHMMHHDQPEVLAALIERFIA